MIYILDKIDYNRRLDLETPDVESISVEIKFKNSKPSVIQCRMDKHIFFTNRKFTHAKC